VGRGAGRAARGKELCDEALAALPAADSPLRARLLARRAAEATYRWEPEAGPLSEQALAMAERLGGPLALRSALRARQVARGGPDGALDRVSLGSRMLALGLADGDDEAILWGRLWRMDAFAQLGRVAPASAELLSVAPTVARLRSPGPTWHLRRSELALAYGRGEFDRAFGLADECLRLAVHGHENMRSLTASVVVRLNAVTGRDEWLPSSMADFSWSPPFGLAMRALWHLTLGRPDEARECYQRDEAFVSVPGIRYLITYAAFAELCSAFADAEVASAVYAALLPYADLSTFDLARALVPGGASGQAGASGRRGRPGDAAEAAALAASAEAAASRLRMVPLLRSARALSVTLDGAAAGPLTRREGEIAALGGLTNRLIAAALHISERTAENHVQHILTNLGLHTRTQIATWAVAGGL
jgi:DNA-binding NarL/FixJ family response regulator